MRSEHSDAEQRSRVQSDACLKTCTAVSCALAELDRLVPPLQARLKSAVEAEQQHEAKLLKSLYAGGSLRRLQKDGLVLLRLQVGAAVGCCRQTLLF